MIRMQAFDIMFMIHHLLITDLVSIAYNTAHVSWVQSPQD